jgi:hypothetical protein
MEEPPTDKLYVHIPCGEALLIIDETDDNKVLFDASFNHADDHVQLGEPCPFCGAKLTRETLRTARR